MRKAFEAEQRVIWVVEVGSVHCQAETSQVMEQDYQSLDVSGFLKAKGFQRHHSIVRVQRYQPGSCMLRES